MTQTAFKRDGILDADERTEAAQKCLTVLADVDLDEMRAADRGFLISQRNLNRSLSYKPDERGLAWLRDLVERYCT